MRRVLSLLIAVSVLVSLLALAPMAGAATPTGWTKIADKGIDNPNIALMFPSVEFQGKLYFWVPYLGGMDAAPVWSYDGTTFSKAALDGFGDPNNIILNSGIVYQDHLYMGTGNMGGLGQVWRTADGTTWERVGETTFTTPNQSNAQLLGEQGGKLLIGLEDYTVGAQVWAYDGTDPGSPSAFTRANNDGFGLNVSPSVICSEISNGAQFDGRVQVCANLYDVNNGNLIGFVPLEYRGGKNWVQTAQNNFGDANNINGVSLMATVGGAAYAGTQNYSGGQLWKLDGSGWNRVPTGGINPAQSNFVVPAALGDQLEVCTSMFSTDGTPVGPARVYLQNPDGSFYLWIDQFDDPVNMVIVASEFKGQYVAGAGNLAGFQVWTSPIPLPTPATAFYFAEGTTRTNFQEYLCLGNSGDQAAIASVTYIFTDGTTKDASYTVPANSRYTVDVNSVVGLNKDLSLKVLADSPDLVAERPMYFNYNGVWTGGSDAVGATAPDTKWYFAEGTTLPEFDQYVTVLNPGSTMAGLTFHYMVEGEGQKDVTAQVGPNTRATFKTRDQIGNGKNVSLYLESSSDVVAERPMYFNYLGLAANNWTGGHDVVGTNSPNTDWYFAEGTTRKNSVDGAFEQWLCLQNPGTSPITVNATYQLAVGQGDPISKSYKVPAQQRLTVSVNREIGQDKDCSVYLHSGSVFIAERPMYFSYHAYAWTGGHDVLGTNSAATTWFFAEGTTRANFEEWLCLQNPGNGDAHTTITYYTTSGRVITNKWTVKANTRLTVSANSDVGPNQDISTRVSSDKPIIVERPMYFNYQGVWTGGHDVVGFVPSQ